MGGLLMLTNVFDGFLAKSTNQKGINNMQQFTQPFDFSTFCIRGQDVDFEAEIHSELWLRADFKFGFASLKKGQRIAAENWVRTIGRTKHAFFAVANHFVEAPEMVTADDLLVTEVIFKTPEMSDLQTYKYDGFDEPSWNCWLSTLALRFGYTSYLNPETVELDEYWAFDPAFSAAHDSAWARRNRDWTRQKLEADIRADTGHPCKLPPITWDSPAYRASLCR